MSPKWDWYPIVHKGWSQDRDLDWFTKEVGEAIYDRDHKWTLNQDRG